MAHQTIPCRICPGRAEHVCNTPNRYSRTSPLHHYRCAGCGLVFVADDIHQVELTQAYTSQDRPVYYGEIRDTHRKKMTRSLRDLQSRFSLQATRILDVGTGDGEFPRLLMEQGAGRVFAHDLPGVDLRKLRQRGCKVYQDTDFQSLPERGFDVICLLDVLEHVLDPHHLLRSCRRALDNGGYVYLHTPVVTRLDRLFRSFLPFPGLRKLAVTWQMSRTTVFHLRNFTRASLAILLKTCGFEVITYSEENELSWPIRKYVHSFLTGPAKFPTWTTGIIAGFVRPVVSSPFLNANKAIVLARRCDG